MLSLNGLICFPREVCPNYSPRTRKRQPYCELKRRIMLCPTRAPPGFVRSGLKDTALRDKLLWRVNRFTHCFAMLFHKWTGAASGAVCVLRSTVKNHFREVTVICAFFVSP
jgi:hypothetical protein